MARMAAKEPRDARVRRQFTDEFKGRRSPAGLGPSALAGWVKHARADRDGGKSGLTTDERAELAKLRKENRELKMERELLKKWAAFFAKESA